MKDVDDFKDCVICRCEDVTLSEVLRAIREDDAISPQEVKMLTRAGKGMCGGRICGNVVSRVVAAENGRGLPDLAWTRRRPPVRPTPLRDVADPSVDSIFDASRAQLDLPSAAEREKKS